MGAIATFFALGTLVSVALSSGSRIDVRLTALRPPPAAAAVHDGPWKARPGQVIAGDCILEPGADCAGVDLSQMRLATRVERFTDLQGIDLSGADLSGAVLIHVLLAGADLSGADLTGARIEHSTMSGVDLSGADLTGATFYMASLRGTDLTGAIGYEPSGTDR